MEDLNAYIESGILELYVLGDLPDQERQEVERMLEKHPELKQEVAEIEKALELFADKQAVEPPDQLKNKVLAGLDIREDEKAHVDTVTIRADTGASIIEMKGTRSGNFYKYAFAASVALLLLSLFVLINLYTQLEESRSQIASLRESNEQFSQRVNVVEGQLQGAKQSLEVFHKPEEYKMVNLKGTPKAPTASMMVAFSAEKSEVMIDLASINMPSTDESHQYQLWALVDGKPVDLGVFDAKSDTTGMIKMKSLKEAQAFAVTLEPKGGSVSPTLEQMMLMGAI